MQRAEGSEYTHASAGGLPSDKLIFSRSALYVQAVVFPLTVVLAFALGYLAGRGRIREPQGDVATAQAAVQNRVPVEGRVIGDSGSLIIVLPAAYDKPIQLTATDVQGALADGPSEGFQKMVEQMGGEIATLKPTGDFFTYVSSPGNYHILIVARNVLRPAGLSIDIADRGEMAHYFADPNAAIANQDYRWMPRTLTVEAAKPIEAHFGS